MIGGMGRGLTGRSRGVDVVNWMAVVGKEKIEMRGTL